MRSHATAANINIKYRSYLSLLLLLLHYLNFIIIIINNNKVLGYLNFC